MIDLTTVSVVSGFGSQFPSNRSETWLPLVAGSDVPKLQKESYFRQGPGAFYSEKAVIHAKITDESLPVLEGKSAQGGTFRVSTQLSAIDSEFSNYHWWKSFPFRSISIVVEPCRGQIPLGNFNPVYWYFPIKIYSYWYDDDFGNWRLASYSGMWRSDTGTADHTGPFSCLSGLEQTFKKNATIQFAMDTLQPYFDKIGTVYPLTDFGGWYKIDTIPVKWGYIDYPSEPLEAAFIAGEPSMFRHVGEVGVSPHWPDGSMGEINMAILKQAAVKDAFDNMPMLSDNEISNAIEVITFLATLRSNWGLSAPGKLTGRALNNAAKDAWLSYRYVYGTTVMDAQEAMDYLNRTVDLNYITKFKLYGISHLTYHGITMTCRVQFEVENRKLSALKDGWAWLRKYGLQPNLYVAWDMTPFSFVVDWFIPVGDLASSLDAQQFLDKDDYHCSTPTYSISYTRDDLPGKPHCYTRWIDAMPSTLIGATFQDKHVSDKTRYKRLADAYSLFT